MTSPLEPQRLALQALLDSQKTQAERNKAGQFATPTALAQDVLRHGLRLLGQQPLRFFDPAFGTGSFYSALQAVRGSRRVENALAFELDPHYGKPAQELWSKEGLELRLTDFTREPLPGAAGKPTLLICNPPYSRHHHLSGDEKARLQALVYERAGIKLSGLAGLYAHFLAISHGWLAADGIGVWLIPSEFLEVNFGRELKKHLLRDVELLRVHRFDPNDVQFDDALVSSAVVCYRNRLPAPTHEVQFSYGGTLDQPAQSAHIPLAQLHPEDKWTRYPMHGVAEQHVGFKLGDLFAIKRGLATGDNKFFILGEDRVNELGLPREVLRPILPSTRYVPNDVIETDQAGVPLLERRLFLLDCKEPEDVVQEKWPTLAAYLKTGQQDVASSYICSHRSPWYSQENRGPAPIICTYIGRSDHDGRPFRFILNRSRATATNVFLMLYPKPILAKALAGRPALMEDLWRAMNSIPARTLLNCGRVYGGGMHKLEPKELAAVPADELAMIAGLAPAHEQRPLELA